MAYLKYKMHRTGHGGGMKAPDWIEDGGYFIDPDTNEMIGWSADEADREYYVPDTVTEYTQAELIAYVQDVHSRYPMQNLSEDGVTATNMTDAEVATYVTNWCANFEG